MEQLELRIAIPFRLDGIPEQWPGCLFHYDSRLKTLYMEALSRELAAASCDSSEAQICAVTLEGCFFLLEYEQLTALARTVRRYFPLTKDASWRACCEPGRLSTGILNFCKNMELYELCIDYRTSSQDEARSLGFPPPYVEMQHTKQVLDHSVFSRFTLRISDADCNRTDEQWKETLRDAAGFGPMAIRLPAGISDSRHELAVQKLKTFHYGPLSGYPTVFVKPGTDFSPVFEADGVIGCGLGAVTRLDGLACQNTCDLELYLKSSAQIEKIAHPLPE